MFLANFLWRREARQRYRARRRAAAWERNGRVPGARGYGEAKWSAIERGIDNATAGRYGWNDAGLDERVVEYPWIFERLRTLLRRRNARVLDAGSALNHGPILERWRQGAYGPLSIVTRAYEGFAQVSNEVRYEFADLRELPYRDQWFEAVVCLSTIEHVGMDNTRYGDASRRSAGPAGEAARAMAEFRRVTGAGGRLLLTVPFGARSDRRWLRVFDAEDLGGLTGTPGWAAQRARFFRATAVGWRESDAAGASGAGYNEPARGPGVQTAPAWVAAAEAVALVELART